MANNVSHCDTCTCAKHLSPERKEALIESLRKSHDETLGLISEWPGKLGMEAMYTRDAGDYLQVAYLLQENEPEKAEKHASYLDTGARDKISKAVWNYLLLFRE